MTAAEKSEEPSTPIARVIAPSEALEAVQSAAPSEEKRKDIDPKAFEEYEFSIDEVDAQGRSWRGEFKNRILTTEDKMNVGLTAARMVGGVPFIAIDDDTAGLIQAVAHMTISMVEKPPWFVVYGKDSLKNQRLLNQIYGEVLAHETTFRGPPPAPPTSKD